MASLAQIYGAMTEVDMVKEAEAEEAAGVVYVDEDVLEKAAEYDAIGRRLAHQMWAQVEGDPELFKEAMGESLPPALAALAAKKGEGKKEEEEEEEEGEEKSEEKKEKAAKLEEKKAAVMQAMYEDDEYLRYILDKYTEPVE